MRGGAFLNFLQQRMQQKQDFRLGLWAMATGHMYLRKPGVQLPRSNAAKPATANGAGQAVHSKVALLSGDCLVFFRRQVVLPSAILASQNDGHYRKSAARQ
jgi:hypothetical protein